MGEVDFQHEVIDRLARMETKQDATMATVADHAKCINQHSVAIKDTDSRARSAHHRIDGIFWGAGILGGAVGAVVNFISSFWGKGGSHG
ncbi:hypothetical protein [Pelosinus propionicus]|uniref:Haemolysin XhlA n=1 Tax=Pelosinus propionicus DSM 13327 TaxID=1123291 RepID=A0A1I4QMT3_9FIRM|nr:hypothetical protein [Pelosinus propionicus]SFM41339.1 hypothetical protein SAMN04490355_11142 [Pelosinus propionicus DSM 13327]